MLVLVYHMDMSATVKIFMIISILEKALYGIMGINEERNGGIMMEFSDLELSKLLKFIRMTKDQSRELYEAMIDIETYGEVDHDGMPVVNSLELKEDIEDMDRLIARITQHLSEKKQL